MFPRAYSWLHVSLRLQLVTCFPGLQLAVYFPALAAGYMFPRAYSWLHVSPRLELVTCFLAACCWSHVSSPWPLVTWGIVLFAISNNSFTPHSYLLDWFLFFLQILMNHSWLIVLSLRPWIIAGTKIYSFTEDDTEENNIIVGCCWKIKSLERIPKLTNTEFCCTYCYILQCRLAVFCIIYTCYLLLIRLTFQHVRVRS